MPNFPDVYDAATDIVKTLKALRLECCFIGGMACSLYGLSRVPKDIDVLIVDPPKDWDQEFIKRQLVEQNARFYLVPAKKPGATHKVLWYRLPTLFAPINEINNIIKIDILVPGAMDLPAVPKSNVVWIRKAPNNAYSVWAASQDCEAREWSQHMAEHMRRLLASQLFGPNVNSLARFRVIDGTWPTVPYDLLLMTKLQAWSQRRASSVQYYRAKVPADHADLTKLLEIGRSSGKKVYPVKEEGKLYLSDGFIEVTKKRVIEHVREHPECFDSWMGVGFTSIGLEAVVQRSDMAHIV